MKQVAYFCSKCGKEMYLGWEIDIKKRGGGRFIVLVCSDENCLHQVKLRISRIKKIKSKLPQVYFRTKDLPAKCPNCDAPRDLVLKPAQRVISCVLKDSRLVFLDKIQAWRFYN